MVGRWGQGFLRCVQFGGVGWVFNSDGFGKDEGEIWT